MSDQSNDAYRDLWAESGWMKCSVCGKACPPGEWLADDQGDVFCLDHFPGDAEDEVWG